MSENDDTGITIKQAKWEITKALNRRFRKEPRGVATTIATVRKKRPCTCGHTMKHHKKSGRCRGKILTPQQTTGQGIAKGFRVPVHLIGIPASCPCDAGIRERAK